jgi:hypothetical protein
MSRRDRLVLVLVLEDEVPAAHPGDERVLHPADGGSRRQIEFDLPAGYRRGTDVADGELHLPAGTAGILDVVGRAERGDRGARGSGERDRRDGGDDRQRAGAECGDQPQSMGSWHLPSTDMQGRKTPRSHPALRREDL